MLAVILAVTIVLLACSSLGVFVTYLYLPHLFLDAVALTFLFLFTNLAICIAVHTYEEFIDERHRRGR